MQTTNNPQTTSVSLSTLFDPIPFTTRFMGGLCIFFFLLGLFYPISAGVWCLRPTKVVLSLQLWRILSSPLLHAGFIHLFMNMLALVKLGPALERDMMGSLQFYALNLLLMVTCGLIHCTIDFMLQWIGYGGWNNCAVGFSGVLFAYLAIHCHLSPHPYRFFGSKVPATIYPWLSILFIQIMVPAVSLTGHISGILAAYLYIFNVTSWILPSPALLQRIESSSNFLVNFLVNRPSYVLNPFLGLPSAPSSQAPPSVATKVIHGVSSIFSKVEDTEKGTPNPVGVPTTFQSYSGEGHRLSDPPREPIEKVKEPVETVV